MDSLGIIEEQLKLVCLLLIYQKTWLLFFLTSKSKGLHHFPRLTDPKLSLNIYCDLSCFLFKISEKKASLSKSIKMQLNLMLIRVALCSELDLYNTFTGK